MTVIVRQPRNLPRFAYQKMEERTRFENPEASETLDPDLIVSFSITYTRVRSRVEPVKPDRTR